MIMLQVHEPSSTAAADPRPPAVLRPAVTTPRQRLPVITIALTAALTTITTLAAIRTASAPRPDAPRAVPVVAPARPALPATHVEPEGDCTTALTGHASDAVFRACAAAGNLGACHLYDQPDCPTCACHAYVGVDGLCANGTCAAPLDGSGCADGGFYRARPAWQCRPGADEAACMLRHLASLGTCGH